MSHDKPADDGLKEIVFKAINSALMFHQFIISYDAMILTKEIHGRSREVMPLQLLLIR